jgi:hypothetical protein
VHVAGVKLDGGKQDLVAHGDDGRGLRGCDASS